MSSIGYGRQNPSARSGFDVAGELVRIVSQLAQDIERFDLMIRDQRHLLQQHRANVGRPDERVLRRQTRRISDHADVIASRSQGALEQLRGLSESSPPNPS